MDTTEDSYLLQCMAIIYQHLRACMAFRLVRFFIRLTMPDSLSYTQAVRFNRHIVLPQIDLDGQERLARARVLIIGMGGLGCPAAQSLCAGGVGHLTLVDDDRVELHNLPRQLLFTEQDIGQYKVSAAFHRLHQQNSTCQITPVSKTAEHSGLLSQLCNYDLILDCTDNIAARQLIAHHAWQSNVPLISAAALRFEAQLFISAPSPDNACYNCLPVNSDAGDCMQNGIFSPIVTLAGSYQALVAMQWLSQCTTLPVGKLVMFDGMSHQWQTFGVPKSPHCDTCHTKKAP